LGEAEKPLVIAGDAAIDWRRDRTMRNFDRRIGMVMLLLSMPFQGSMSWAADPATKEIEFMPALEARTIDKQDWNRSTPERCYLGIFTANKTADSQWIVEGFAPAERDSIRKMVADKPLLEANTQLFSNTAKETIAKKIIYGDYVILVVEAIRTDGRHHIRNIPFKRVGSDWLVTNDLSADKVFVELKSGYIGR
jgi:hypothetical protein